jgi:hypothetical protein
MCGADEPPKHPAARAIQELIGTRVAERWRDCIGQVRAARGELLSDPSTAGFDTRIDHVLTRGAEAPTSMAKLTGLDMDNRTPSGLWPFDQAGVITTLFP